MSSAPTDALTLICKVATSAHCATIGASFGYCYTQILYPVANGNIVTVTKHTHREGCFIMIIIYINKIYLYNKTFRMYGG